MSIVDIRPGAGGVRFLGNRRAYWRLLVRGASLLLVTLGIYRFWLNTDIRRFLWSNTEVAGEPLEYTGTAFELLVGFLVAIAILIPIYVAFFVAALDLGIVGRLSGVAGFVLLALLGQYAVYRARRYRLTRTVFRGLRFHQTGSAWRYAICALFWWGLTFLTLGLAYPWKEAALERFKMRNTFYGDLAGRFEGSASRLFWRGIPIWLTVFLPLLASIAALVRAFNWKAIADAIQQGGGEEAMGKIEGANPALAGAIVFSILAFVFSVLAATALYPAFQAMVLRWWTSGLRFGGLEVNSYLRTGAVYGAYGRFVGYSLLFAIALSILSIPGALIVQALVAGESSTFKEALASVLLVGGYVIMALGYSTIYRATVMFSLWQLSIDSIELKGADALDKVKATGGPSSALGEGFADALNVGGI